MAAPEARRGGVAQGLANADPVGRAGVGAFNALPYTGLQTTAAVNGLLLQSLQPALIVVLGASLFSKRVRPLQPLGMDLSITGALVIISNGDSASVTSLRFNVGDLVIACAAC